MEKFKSFMIQIVLYPIVFNSLFDKLVLRKQLVLLFYYYFGGRGVDGEVRQKAKLKLPNKKKKHLFLKFQF